METIKTGKYKLAIDGHVLLQKEKTGVGWTAQYLIDELVKNKDIDVQINFVDFLGYRCRKLIRHYRSCGCKIKFCWWMPYSVYLKIFKKFKIPYYFLFGRKNNATLFFEYYVPYKVGTKTVNYVYDVNYKVYPETVEDRDFQWLNKNMQIYCDRSDIIITISEFSKREIKKYLKVDSNSIHVVHNGVDFEKYNKEISQIHIDSVRKKYGIEGKYILYLGTLEPRKNIAVLIEAYHKLMQQRDKTPKLVIAGRKGWKYEHLFQMVSDFKLNEEIIFIGYIDKEDNPALLSGAEIFVFPSLYEGFGMPPLEAMACGTPVIVSDAASLPEVVGDSGMIFHATDAENLRDKISLLLDSEEKREELSISGMNRAKNFTWENVGKKLAGILRTV